MDRKLNWMERHQKTISVIYRIALISEWTKFLLKLGQAVSLVAILYFWRLGESLRIIYISALLIPIAYIAVTMFSRYFTSRVVTDRKRIWSVQRKHLTTSISEILPALEKLERALPLRSENVNTALQKAKDTATSSRSQILSSVADMDSIIERLEKCFSSDTTSLSKIAPRFSSFFRQIVPQETRQKCFDPAYSDMLKHYLQKKRPCSIYPELHVAVFIVRIGLMAADCFRVMLQESIAKSVMSFLSGVHWNWWRSR